MPPYSCSLTEQILTDDLHHPPFFLGRFFLSALLCDEIKDVVGASYYDSSLRWYENDGTGIFTEHLISNGVVHGQGVTLADLDK